MRRYLSMLALAALPLPGAMAPAQDSAEAVKAEVATATAPANDDSRPAGVKVARHGTGEILVDARGRTLYFYNARVARGRNGDALAYCVGPCTKVWAPLRPPAGAKPVGRWTVVTGAQGPQWALRGNPVFTFIADTAPGATGGDGYDDLWTTIEHVPPAPRLAAPPVVTPRYSGGRYILADPRGHALYTAAGDCTADCAPLVAGLAARPLGDWSVMQRADRATWAYRGRPVFVAKTGDDIPDGGAPLLP